ncbi:MAG: hypothetical protein A2W61_02185 [Deltaproteobacteria bacterium RIFCSPLOWO2_01_44_7]|nr:MAG: hypothetical protein A2712_05315 [Deltaproteobacteria bacterium RIFCSPHIGHO2_01_FULL_43_49]OGQ14378.1 MAG: hypothetical protein A3D22_05070 [Deltaproteobacteria bacterium RIFCSPHIGHO2_02_FULL_44_53]OGQ27582.1 MAG: hypothetical protein A3D98_09105 [Deltaproteobacteria bacterium RIFCSPHIGHO2_12_FULL_44_21]OGQ30819.1 MAG: hypothetical protein A2979_01480 [Deltaproteobacteria bacterium RIFCSPLOWO2_01_FULL_45_74]OGQ37485.1 MAG: hypothetical protein A2W61_02185 [Deltaproteobacteria bacterium 
MQLYIIYTQVKKHERQTKIKEIVHSHKVHTQEELGHLLEKASFEVTQATLSRDIAEIPLIKKGGMYYDGSSGTPQLPAQRILGVTLSPPNLLILQTPPGLAQSTAYQIDGAKLKGVAGTVAGDDTIMVATKADQSLKEIKQSILKLFNQSSVGHNRKATNDARQIIN